MTQNNIKVIEIRKTLRKALKNIIQRAYYEDAPDDIDFPYIVYWLDDSINDGVLERFDLDVEGYDLPENGDTTQLETLMDSIDKVLHRQKFVVDEALFFIAYRQNRRPAREKENRIKKRLYSYQIRVYGE